VQRRAHLPATSARDVDVKVDTSFATAASGTHLNYVIARRQSTGTYLRIGLAAGGGRLLIRGQTDSGDALFPDTDTALGFAHGTTYSLRVPASRRIAHHHPRPRLAGRHPRTGHLEPHRHQLERPPDPRAPSACARSPPRHQSPPPSPPTTSPPPR
jgi:hypothetical protein